ncbi:MAG: hypothetical protein ACYCPW_03310 [Nitrososphaerales archaeon]
MSRPNNEICGDKMSNEKKEKENLTDLKNRLFTKILVFDAKLNELDEKSDEYRRTLDMYHKIVKSFLDIVKVQHYAPGVLLDQPDEDNVVKVMNKVKAHEALAEADKVALQEFKDFLDYVNKVSLSARKEE